MTHGTASLKLSYITCKIIRNYQFSFPVSRIMTLILALEHIQKRLRIQSNFFSQTAFLRILGFHERIPMTSEFFPLVFTNRSVIQSDAALSLLQQPARDFPRKCLKGRQQEIQRKKRSLLFDLTLPMQGGNKSGKSHTCLNVTCDNFSV